MCIEHKVFPSIQSNEAALVKHDNNMKDYSHGGWLITITANHSNYLTREPTRSLSLSVKVVNQINYCNALVIKWIYNIVVLSEGRTRCSFFITFNWCICSFLISLWAASMTQAEKFWPFCQEHVNLFNHLLESDVMVVVLRVLFFVDMRLPRILSLICIVEVVLRCWCRSINTIPVS